MGWAGLSIAELCRTILDPAKNGSRSVAELITHMTTDKQGAVGLAAGSRAVSSTSFQGRSEDCPRSLGHGGRAMSEAKELDMLQGSSSVTPSGLSRRDVLKALGAGTAVLVAGRLGRGAVRAICPGARHRHQRLGGHRCRWPGDPAVRAFGDGSRHCHHIRRHHCR
jgi:hypothetical protein